MPGAWIALPPCTHSVDQEGSVVGSFEGGEPTHNIKHHPLSQEESSNVDE
jgi:hypothetical protein